MSPLDEIANSIYFPEIPFQQKNTTFQDFLNARAINGIKLTTNHKIEKTNNQEFQLQILYEDKKYLLAIKFEQIKKPSEYTKKLESQITSPDVNGAIIITSLTLNRTIDEYLRKFPVEIIARHYLQKSNVRQYSPIEGSQILDVESPEIELLELSGQLKDAIKDFQEKKIKRKKLHKATKRLQSRLQVLNEWEIYNPTLDTAYDLLTQKVEHKPIQVKKIEEIDLAKLIRNEKLTLTDKVTENLSQSNETNPDYFIFWKMQGKKTIFRKGIITLVYNERVNQSFIEALEEKYEIKIPNTEHIDYLINNRIKKAKKFQDKK